MDLSLAALTRRTDDLNRSLLSEASDEFLAAWTLLRTCSCLPAAQPSLTTPSPCPHHGCALGFGRGAVNEVQATRRPGTRSSAPPTLPVQFQQQLCAHAATLFEVRPRDAPAPDALARDAPAPDAPSPDSRIRDVSGPCCVRLTN